MARRRRQKVTRAIEGEEALGAPMAPAEALLIPLTERGRKARRTAPRTQRRGRKGGRRGRRRML